jgi:hypothetical protein
MPNFPLQQHKVQLLDFACERYRVSSAVDVGGCWGVNGGYCFHVVDQHNLKEAYIVDGLISKETIDQKGSRNVQLIQGDICGHEFISSLPELDMAIIYDILLHQVDPNWDEFLKRYAKKVNHFAIYNQDWDGENTIRFVDYDCNWYLDNVMCVDNDEVIRWYKKHNEICIELKRPWKDVHYFWQWGITAPELIRHMDNIGFQLDFFWNYGYFDLAKPKIENHGYLFSRRGLYKGIRIYPDKT